jgi:hypothetical protein
MYNTYEDASAIEIARDTRDEARDRIYNLEKRVAVLEAMFEIVAKNKFGDSE